MNMRVSLTHLAACGLGAVALERAVAVVDNGVWMSRISGQPKIQEREIQGH